MSRDFPHLHQSYDPPTFPFYASADLTRFRFLLNERGWAVGIIWSSQQFAGLPGRAGIAPVAMTKTSQTLVDYLVECSEEKVNGVDAYQAMSADSRAKFSDEFEGTGVELEQARQWLLGRQEDVTFAEGRRLPMRTKAWDEPLDASHRLDLAHDNSCQSPCLLASGSPRLVRADQRWWVVPESDTTINFGPARPRVRQGFVAVYDAYGDDIFGMTQVVKAFMGAEAPSTSAEPGGLWVAYNDDDEVRGLLLSTSAGEHLRGEGRWFRLPAKSPIVDGSEGIEVRGDAIRVWDELEAVNKHHDFDQRLAYALAPDRDLVPAMRYRLFDFVMPSEISISRDPHRPDVIAQGPFAVEVYGHRILGCDLAWHGDEVRWWDGSKSHLIDTTCQTTSYETHVMITDAYSDCHYMIRPLELQDAAWALPPGGPRPDNVDELRQQAERLLRRPACLDADSVANAVPVDSSWLIVDVVTGHIFSELTVVVPEPPHDIYERLQAHDAGAERMDYASEYGLKLLMPGSRTGTPLDELEDWDDPPWLIDLHNGDATWEPWSVLIVPRPDDADVYDDLRSEQDLAIGYASDHGRIPVAPCSLH